MKRNRRQFTRITLPLPIILNFGKKKYECLATNLSLGGIYIQGCFEQQAGDICDIKLSLSKTDPELHIKAICSVVRLDKNGFALQFTSMEPSSYLFLQEALLYIKNAHWCEEPNGDHPPLYPWKIP